MNLPKQIIIGLALSLAFLLGHVLIASFKPGDLVMLYSTLSLMVCMEVFGFLILKRNFEGRPLKFVDIFFLLCMAMSFSVILLAVNSAYNPFVDQKPFNISEIMISLLIFSGIFTSIVTAIIWMVVKKREKAGS